MEIKRCYDTIIGASVVENQLCNGESVTVPNEHKYYLKTGGTESLGASTGTAITGLTSGSDMVIDLTQMLGTAIANYVYSLETATTGSGIAWLRSYDLITDEYKPYNTGTIESVEATAKVVRDENNENAVTYPLGSDVLRGFFKLDASNKLYADGDTKTSDGTITRMYGIITFDGSSDEYWRAETSPTVYTGTNFYIARPADTLPFERTNDYAMKFMTPIAESNINMGGDRLTPTEGWLNFIVGAKLNISTVSDFRTYLASHPIVLQYPIVETTETGDPFPSPQIVYPDGTEEFVTETGVPVGHETKYQL